MKGPEITLEAGTYAEVLRSANGWEFAWFPQHNVYITLSGLLCHVR